MPRLVATLTALLALALLLITLPPQARPAAAAETTPRLLAPRAQPAWLRSAAGNPAKGAATAPGLYLLLLTAPPLASYTGGLPGLAATSPAALGRTALDADSPAARAYLSHLDAGQRRLLARLTSALERPVEAAFRYRYTLNGLAVALSPAEAHLAATLPDVQQVRLDELRQLAAAPGPVLIGAAQPDLRPALFQATLRGAEAVPPTTTPAVGRAIVTYDGATRRLSVQLSLAGLAESPTWARLLVAPPGAAGPTALDLTPLGTAGGSFFAGEATLAATQELSIEAIEAALAAGEAALAVGTSVAPEGALRGQLRPARGEGIVAGVIDGGINASHPAFAAQGADGYIHTNPLGRRLGVCAPGAGFAPPFPCSDKLVGAYTFAATAGAPDPFGRPSPFDDDGHGTHTAATLAGNFLAASAVAGVEQGPIAGVAPHANLVAYDVCGTSTGSACPISAIVAAVEQAVADGVTLINFSISGLAGDPWEDLDALAMLGALEAGVQTTVAVGNGGPTAGSVGAPANAPWVLAVGASTHNRRSVRALDGLAGGASTPPPRLEGDGVGAEMLPPRPIFDAASLLDAFGAANPYCIPFARDTRLEGAILVCRQLLNSTAIAQSALNAGASGLVIVWPEAARRQLPVEAMPLPTVHLDATTGAALARWLASGAGHTAGIAPATETLGAQADQVAWFSARGPNTQVPAVLKPDLVAPGLNILAATTAFDQRTDAFALLSGTSMAAPHVAGAAALLRQLHPGWTPSAIHSALVTTALPAVSLEDGTPASPHAGGAGRVRVGEAARAGLLLEETAARFRAANPAAGGNPASLNLPTLGSDACLERCVFTRTLRSALPVVASWEATADGDARLILSVEPARFALGPGASLILTVTAQIAAGTPPDEAYVFGTVTLSERDGLAPPARLPVTLYAPNAILPGTLELRALTAVGTQDTPALRTRSSESLTLRVLGPSRGVTSTLLLAQDPTPLDPLDGPPGVISRTLEIPAGTPRVYVATQANQDADIDLFLFADGEGGSPNGQPEEDELICVSASFASDEACDLTLDERSTARLIVIVQSYKGSGAPADRVELLVTMVPLTSADIVQARGPTRVEASTAFTVELAWALPDTPEAAGRYLGVLQVSSTPDPERAGDLGVVPLELIYLRQRSFMPHLQR